MIQTGTAVGGGGEKGGGARGPKKQNMNEMQLWNPFPWIPILKTNSKKRLAVYKKWNHAE